MYPNAGACVSADPPEIVVGENNGVGICVTDEEGIEPVVGEGLGGYSR